MSPGNELLRGRFDKVHDRRPTSVRIFISSTFSDTMEERDELMKNVYPKLRDYCLQTYNIQFQVHTALSIQPTLIHDELYSVSDDQAPSYNKVIKWFREDIEDHPRLDRPVIETTPENTGEVRPPHGR